MSVCVCLCVFCLQCFSTNNLVAARVLQWVVHFFVNMSVPPARKRQKRETSAGDPAASPSQSSVAGSPALGKAVQKRINDQLGETNKRALIWIWNYFNEDEHQGEILMCKEQLSNGMMRVSVNKDVDASNSFHSTYVTFASLPKYWIAAFLVQYLQMTAVCVDSLNGTGKEGRLKHVWTNITGIDDYTHWPADVHDKVLLVKFLMWMIERLGNRHRTIVFSPTFSVDWDHCGPYKLTWGKRGDMQCVIKIFHKQSKTEAMCHHHNHHHQHHLVCFC